MFKRSLTLLPLLLILLLAACTSDDEGEDAPPPTSTPETPTEFRFYSWVEDFPQEVLDAFGAANNVTVRYDTYETQEEALANIRAGAVYDVLVLDNQYVKTVINENRLATLNQENIPNFRHVSPDFRDLTYDPGNQHSMPYNWGTIGVIVRTDLVETPVTAWRDVWREEFQGKIGIWGLPRSIIGATLMSLGYEPNTTDRTELEEARQQLLALRPGVVTIVADSDTLANTMAAGDIVIAMGFAGDVVRLREENVEIEYILPEEGAILWGDNYVIPANSPNQALAEKFLDYVLTPEVGAQIFNYNFYASPSEAVKALIDPAYANDTVIFPPSEDIQNSKVLLPVDPETEAIYDQIWAEFIAEA